MHASIPLFFIHSIRRILVVVCMLGITLLLQACSTPQPTAYTPQLGQMGKDVMWLPTRDELMIQLLQVAKVGPDDLVVDLGAGDGKIPIAAARQFGARAWGVEYNKNLALLAQDNAVKAGVSDRVQIVQGDIFKEDFSKATVVTMYLLEELNAQLRPTILAMRPGTRVLSNTFSMGDWEPDQVIQVANSTGYFWTVPAGVGGVWSIAGISPAGDVKLSITQKYQRIAGTLTSGKQTQALLGARMDGGYLHFSYLDREGQLKSVKVLIQGETMTGEIVGLYGMLEYVPPIVKITGQRISAKK